MIAGIERPDSAGRLLATELTDTAALGPILSHNPGIVSPWHLGPGGRLLGRYISARVLGGWVGHSSGWRIAMGECWLGAQYRSAECGDPKIAGFVTYILVRIAAGILVRIAAGAELGNATKKAGAAVDLLQIQQT